MTPQAGGSLNIHAEILKLARLLRVEPDRLSYLRRVDAEDVKQLREQATEMLFSAHDQTLSRLAAASRLLPVGLTARLAERTFGPILCARMAGVLDPDRAVDIAARLPAPFLAEVASHIDPRRTAPVIGGIPPERIAEIASQLVAREDFVTMGRAVGQLSPAALRAAMGVLDDASLLRAAFVMEDKESLSQLADLLDEERLIGLIDAAEESGLQEEAIDLLGHVDEARREALLAIIAERDEKNHQEVLDRLAKLRS
jgi:hypothetical protein